MNCPACLFCFDSQQLLATHLQERRAAKDELHEKLLTSNSACSLLPETTQTEIESNKTEKKKKIKIRRHKCSQCQKAFVRPAELFRHFLTHTGEKRFKCECCGRHFQLKHHLDDHAKTHIPFSNTESIQCSVCRKNFLSNSALKLHIRIHTKQMPFGCEDVTCGQSFRTKKMMYVHLYNTHLNPSKAALIKQTVSEPSTSTCQGILQSLSSISQLQRSTIKTSVNTAFTRVSQTSQQPDTTSDDRLEHLLIAREMVVIRVQLRSGSVVAGSFNSNLPTNILLDPSALSQLAIQGRSMHIPLKKLALQLNLMLSLDPGAVLNRLKMQSSNNTSGSMQACFTSVVYPTVQHVLTQPPLPFSIISVRKEDEVKILRSHMPSFLIECFLAPTQNGVSGRHQCDPQSRQSCLPILYSEL